MDKLPPHNLEAEAAVLGALLTDSDFIAEISLMLHPDAFYDGANRMIYKAMLALWDAKRPCDIVTLTDLLLDRGRLEAAGGHARLGDLLTSAPRPYYANHYAEIVMAYAQRRAVIEASSRFVGYAYKDKVDISELTAELRREHEKFAWITDESGHSFTQSIVAARELAQQRWDGTLQETIVPTGIVAIDRNTYGGFRGGDLIVFAAASGMGKTALALQIAINAARHDKHPLFVELEMKREALNNRAIATEAGVSYGVAYQTIGDLQKREAWVRASHYLERLNLDVETDLYTTAKIRAYCERAALTNPVDIVFIDHLDYLSDPDLARMNTQERTAETSKRLKRIAMELNIPIVILSQLNREVLRVSPYKPTLGHVRNSGAVVQDAEYVYLIYCRHFYVKRGELGGATEDYLEGGSSRERVEITAAKCRNGDPSMFLLGWEPEFMKYYDVLAS